MPGGFPLQDTGPGMAEMFHDLGVEQSEDKLRRDLIAQLVSLTSPWTTYEDIPGSQKSECQIIGKKLWNIGGMKLMQDAYYTAKNANPAASTIQAYWDGIGDWRW